MLTIDENIGDSTLASLLLQSVLPFSAIRQIVQLDDAKLDALLLQKLLGHSAVRAGSL